MSLLDKPIKTAPQKNTDGSTLLDGSWLSGDGGTSKPLYTNRAFRERDHVGVVVGFEGEAKADLAGESGIAGFSFKDVTPEQAGN